MCLLKTNGENEMQVSFSRVSKFTQCPFAYKLRYIDGLDTLPSDDAANALYVGTGMHEAIEHGAKDGVIAYFNKYPIITDLHLNEALKIKALAPKVQNLIAEEFSGFEVEFEHKINLPDFIGYIDLLVDYGDNRFGIFDFKYSNSIDRYLESAQIHVYKDKFEEANPGKEVIKLGYIFIPKTAIRVKKTETLETFRKRLDETLSGFEPELRTVEFNSDKVREFNHNVQLVENATDYPKCESGLCRFCEYSEFCQKGIDFMLPPNKRRTVDVASKKKVWIYGAPFSGKTTLADQFPNPVMLNTDGNLNSFTAPYVEIKETLEGRIKISAWDNFKATIDELQKGSDFETIVVDLVEDTYEHCRRWCYDKLGIEHESDNSFKAWDYVRNEFLTTMKKLMTLDYNIVLISHEDLSKDITKKTGDKITAIKPNIADKVANKLAGMVDIVARVVADGDDRTLNFKSDDVVFGGGRLKLASTSIPLTYTALEDVYKHQSDVKQEVTAETETRRRRE